MNDATDIIVECYNYPENCAGGMNNFTCANKSDNSGTIGALCESCDFYGSM